MWPHLQSMGFGSTFSYHSKTPPTTSWAWGRNREKKERKREGFWADSWRISLLAQHICHLLSCLQKHYRTNVGRMSISNLFPDLITLHLSAYILLRLDSKSRTAWERINCALFKLTCMMVSSVGRNFANTWIACVLSLICQGNGTNMIVLFVILSPGGWETRPRLLARSFWKHRFNVFITVVCLSLLEL